MRISVYEVLNKDIDPKSFEEDIIMYKRVTVRYYRIDEFTEMFSDYTDGAFESLY